MDSKLHRLNTPLLLVVLFVALGGHLSFASSVTLDDIPNEGDRKLNSAETSLLKSVIAKGPAHLTAADSNTTFQRKVTDLYLQYRNSLLKARKIEDKIASLKAATIQSASQQLEAEYQCRRQISAISPAYYEAKQQAESARNRLIELLGEGNCAELDHYLGNSSKHFDYFGPLNLSYRISNNPETHCTSNKL